jgi:hypothetical protein
MASPHIGLIVMGAETLADYRVFVKTLEAWHPDATLYVYTDSKTPIATVPFKGTVHTRVALDAYTGLTRPLMESRKGTVYKTLWTDFMYEKANVIEWMLETQKTKAGVWFLDADITFLAPLPAIPADKTVALSPHFIRPGDEAKFGKYNGGFLWMNNPAHLSVWRAAGAAARFYEQSALEEVANAADAALYEFPIQVNFGWWRMFQSTEPAAAIAAKFSLFRADRSVGIRYDGTALQSVHTHWYQKDGSATDAFNRFLKDIVARFPTHKPLSQFGKAL